MNFFFNKLGKSNSKSSHDSEAVYVGVVGARFEHPNRMEWQEIILEEDLKKTDDGNENDFIAKLFKDFYKSKIQQGPEKFLDLQRNQRKFNASIYRERIAISAETYLLEANERGKFKNSKVHVVVVGLGLGVWQICSQQVCLSLTEI